MKEEQQVVPSCDCATARQPDPSGHRPRHDSGDSPGEHRRECRGGEPDADPCPVPGIGARGGFLEPAQGVEELDEGQVGREDEEHSRGVAPGPVDGKDGVDGEEQEANVRGRCGSHMLLYTSTAAASSDGVLVVLIYSFATSFA